VVSKLILIKNHGVSLPNPVLRPLTEGKALVLTKLIVGGRLILKLYLMVSLHFSIVYCMLLGFSYCVPMKLRNIT
jgi:hypothetical protein